MGVYVSDADFIQAAANAMPSISENDLREYEALEKAFDDRVGDVQADDTSVDLHSYGVMDNGSSEDNYKSAKNTSSRSFPLQKQAMKLTPNKLRDNHDHV